MCTDSDAGPCHVCSSLNEKGIREAELIQNLNKALEKVSADFKRVEEAVEVVDEQEVARSELAIRWKKTASLQRSALFSLLIRRS